MTDQRELIEAIAVFTENLRDTVVTATGLEQALSTAIESCPGVIEPAVRRLVAGMKYGKVEDALRRFADDLAHPASDFVVAALVSSIQNQTRDLSGLLTQLSASAREECNLCLRIWVTRARTRSAVRIVSGSLLVFVLGLAMFDTQYLAPYASLSGMFVLVLVMGGFGLGLWLLDHMSRVQPAARLVRPRIDS